MGTAGKAGADLMALLVRSKEALSWWPRGVKMVPGPEGCGETSHSWAGWAGEKRRGRAAGVIPTALRMERLSSPRRGCFHPSGWFGWELMGQLWHRHGS